MTDKNDKLQKTLDALEKRYGEGTIISLADLPSEPEVISTGALLLDKATGIMGVPRGRITVLFGKKSAGKSTVAQHIVAEAQTLGLDTLYIDMERGQSPIYAAECGIDIDKMGYSQPDTGEQAMEITEAVVRANIGLVVVDSAASLVPKSEIEREMGDSTWGGVARLLSQAFRKINPLLKHGGSQTAVVFTNQVRANTTGYGALEQSTGGYALQHYASLAIEVRRTKRVKDAGKRYDDIGQISLGVLEKNKLAAPYRTGAFEIVYGLGISPELDIINAGIAEGVIERKGTAYYVLGDETIQGKQKAMEYLRENKELKSDLLDKVRQSIRKDIIAREHTAFGDEVALERLGIENE